MKRSHCCAPSHQTAYRRVKLMNQEGGTTTTDHQEDAQPVKIEKRESEDAFGDFDEDQLDYEAEESADGDA